MAEGSKFPRYCSFAKAIRDELPDHHFLQLCENVILSDQGEVEFFAQHLGVPAVIADATDYKAVSRPRLWWSSIDWTKSRHSPVTGAPLQWTKQHKLHRLHIDDWPTDLWHMETEAWSSTSRSPVVDRPFHALPHQLPPRLDVQPHAV